MQWVISISSFDIMHRVGYADTHSLFLLEPPCLYFGVRGRLIRMDVFPVFAGGDALNMGYRDAELSRNNGHFSFSSLDHSFDHFDLRFIEFPLSILIRRFSLRSIQHVSHPFFMGNPTQIVPSGLGEDFPVAVAPSTRENHQ